MSVDRIGYDECNLRHISFHLGEREVQFKFHFHYNRLERDTTGRSGQLRKTATATKDDVMVNAKIELTVFRKWTIKYCEP
jgi:hypothetical protein